MIIMSAIQRGIIYGLTGLLLVSGASSLYYHHAYKSSASALVATQGNLVVSRAETVQVRKTLDLIKANLELANAALKTRDDKIASLTALKEKSDANLKNALKEHKSWSDAPVPDSVRQSILGQTVDSPGPNSNPTTH